MEIEVKEYGKGFAYMLQCMRHNEQVAVKCRDDATYKSIKSSCSRGASKWSCRFYATRSGDYVKITRIERGEP